MRRLSFAQRGRNSSTSAAVSAPAATTGSAGAPATRETAAPASRAATRKAAVPSRLLAPTRVRPHPSPTVVAETSPTRERIAATAAGSGKSSVSATPHVGRGR
jgi:hypothetical protein